MNNADYGLKFIADIHISPETISELKKVGFNIQRVTEFLPANAADKEIIELAIKEDAVIITQDLDFTNLIIFYGFNKPSLISLRIFKPLPRTITKILTELLPKIKKQLIEGCIVSVTENKFRVRKLS